MAAILAKIESEVSEMLECWRQNAEHKQERGKNERISASNSNESKRSGQTSKTFTSRLNDGRVYGLWFMRECLIVYEQNAVEKGVLTDEAQNWIRWASDKADWYDPLVNREDEVFEFFEKQFPDKRKTEECDE